MKVRILSGAHFALLSVNNGKVPEWLNGQVSKTLGVERLTRVQISPFPQNNFEDKIFCVNVYFMNIKHILLTGDDGYNSIGTRLLVHYLKDSYGLVIAATKDQMSGVGGHISMKTGCNYGEAVVDGVPACWVDGYPVDAVESAVGYFKKPFDLVVSGINWGANVGYGTPSGTMAAAYRALNVNLAPKAIILNWHLPSSHWLHRVKDGDDISEYLSYPGKSAGMIVERAIAEDMWRADVLNINFPAEPTNQVRFTRPLDNMTHFYEFPVVRDSLKKHFMYTLNMVDDSKKEVTTDAGAMLNGYIAVSPLNKSNLNELVFSEVKDKKITL